VHGLQLYPSEAVLAASWPVNKVDERRRSDTWRPAWSRRAWPQWTRRGAWRSAPRSQRTPSFQPDHRLFALVNPGSTAELHAPTGRPGML